MIKSVNNCPVSQLFDIEAGVVYATPRYQCEYTWKMDQWESLFDDVEENAPGYFLGSIICINQTTDTLAVQRLELVDGQQRLTTLSLLFAALYQSLKLHEKDLDDDQRVELINLKRKLVLKKGDDQLRVIPQIQNNNQNDYRAVLSDVGVISPFDTPAYAGNRTDSKGREVGYKNGLKLNAELAMAEAWSIEQIDARTTKLVDQVVSLVAMTGGQPCA